MMMMTMMKLIYKVLMASHHLRCPLPYPLPGWQMLGNRGKEGVQKVRDSGSSMKGRTPKIRYFVTKLSIVATYAFLKGHHRAFYESHPALGVFSRKVSLLSESFWRASFRRAFRELSSSFQRAFVELSESFCRAFRERRDVQRKMSAL